MSYKNILDEYTYSETIDNRFPDSDQKITKPLIVLDGWYTDINFEKKTPDLNGEYPCTENPDTTNGNLKFWFVYKGQPWNVII